MARKLKLTGFARFFILLIILTPLAYLIASYANGEDGMKNLKQLLGIEQQVENSADGREDGKVFVSKAQEVQYLQEENQALRDSLRAKELEVHELRRQIRLLKGSR